MAAWAMGLGFLVSRPDLLEKLEPMEGGGEMIEWVRPEGTTWADIPHRFEAGTPNVAAAAAFPPAIALLEEIGLDAVRAHEEEITGYALERLATLDGLVVYGPHDPARRGGLVSFHDPQVHPHDMSTILDQLGIAIRAGHHCAQPVMDHFCIYLLHFQMHHGTVPPHRFQIQVLHYIAWARRVEATEWEVWAPLKGSRSQQISDGQTGDLSSMGRGKAAWLLSCRGWFFCGSGTG